MAFHIWNGSSWNTIGSEVFAFDSDLSVWNGSSWVSSDNAYVWNGSTWKGFVDKIGLNPDYTYYASGGGDALVQWGVYSSGYVAYTNTSGSTVNQYLWCQNSGNTGQYEISVSLTSGGPLTGTVDTWLSMSSARFWEVFASGIDETVTANIQVSIRHAITQEVMVTEFITLAATTGIDFPI
jgi:hypothetical protein